MILTRLQEWALRQPEAVAIVDGETRLTYRQLLALTSTIGAQLSARASAKEGDCVALSLPNCWQFAVAYMALAERGAIAIPVNTQWRPPELVWLVQRLAVMAVVTSEESREAWDAVAGATPNLSLVMAEDLYGLTDGPTNRDAIDPSVALESGTGGGTATAGVDQRGAGTVASAVHSPRVDATALYLTTSGSTGTPRIVPRSHRMLVTGAKNTGEFLGIRPGMRFLSAVPFYHANGFSNCLLLPLLNGATAVLLRRFTPGRLVELLSREAIQVLIGSPAMFSLLVDHHPSRLAFSTVETCLSSGAPMPKTLRAACADQLGLHVRQLYGSTETGTIAIQPAVAGKSDGDVGLPLPSIEIQSAGDVGLPLPSVEIRIVDENGRDAAEREIGEVLVRAPTTMRGYVGEPLPERPGWPAGFLSTGDLGRLNERGHLVLSGRQRRVINLAGTKVDPTEVERVLRELPQISACRVVAATDHRQLEIVKALIATAAGESLSRAQVVAHCRPRLAEYKIPRVIEFVEAIPADLAGKGPVAWGV